jgi:hypothetical protein
MEKEEEMAEQEEEKDLQEEVDRILKDEEISDADRIKALHVLGFSRKQLMEDFHFPRATVYRALPVHPEKKEEATGDGLPVLRKMGAGVEVITPEAVLRRYMDGGEKDEWELRGMMKLRAAMLMVMDLVNIQKASAEADALRISPILKLMEENRKELDAAAARAKSSSFEMAQEAAQSAVSGVLGYIDQKLPKGPPPKDTSELITRRIDKMWDMMEHMMEQRLMPGYAANKPPEGWEFENRSATNPQMAAQGASSGWVKEERKENADVQSSDVRGQPPADAAGEGGGPASPHRAD